jgi:predicted enzyme related to lactoylglutathione lyase
MGERDHHEPGTFSYADLATNDVDAAKSFYPALFGWETEDGPIPGGGVYTTARLQGRLVAGLSTGQEGQPPAWTSYVTVDGADEAARRAGELGGAVVAEPFDVMELGRMAIIQDATGAFFAIWEPRQSIGAELVNGHGLLSLNQLNTTDPERASQFYSALFGWRFEAVPDTQIPYWGIYRGDTLNAGMMQQPPDAPAPPHWLVYFGIDALDDAAAKIGELGGSVLVPKTDVPGGQFLLAADGQGAIFGLFSGRFDD